jgi:twinkle protein
METIEQSAPNAAQPGAKNETRACQSQSAETAYNGTAGTVDGRAASSTKIGPAAETWVREARHLSRVTLERLGVASGMAFFPDLQRKAEALFFPYSGGWKARAFPEKAFVANKGLKLSFWNIERVLNAAPAAVWICEGELDAMALVEAGISPDAVLSVPGGAKESPADDPKGQRGYAYVDEALKAGLSRVKKFVWCGDADGPGLALRGDMVRLLGAARFHFVCWPEGVKDANEMLISDGSEALRSLVEDGSLPLARRWNLSPQRAS